MAWLGKKKLRPLFVAAVVAALSAMTPNLNAQQYQQAYSTSLHSQKEVSHPRVNRSTISYEDANEWLAKNRTVKNTFFTALNTEHGHLGHLTELVQKIMRSNQRYGKEFSRLMSEARRIQRAQPTSADPDLYPGSLQEANAALEMRKVFINLQFVRSMRVIIVHDYPQESAVDRQHKQELLTFFDDAIRQMETHEVALLEAQY